MASYNKVLLMGNLTRDIELRQLPSGTSVAQFTLAVNEKYKDKNDQWVERAHFIDCEMFGRRAEAMAKYLSKGNPVFIEGRLKLDTWQDKNDGSNRSKLKVFAESFEFVGGGQGGGQGGGGGGGGSRGASQPKRPAQESSYDDYAESQVSPDDIPF